MLFQGVVGDVTHPFVVFLDGCWQLKMSDVLQCGTKASGFMGIIDDCRYFCFSCQCSYKFEDDMGEMDRTIGGDSSFWLLWMVRIMGLTE
jgi:hypothetical protein